MAWYRTGTVAVTNGSTTVTGSGTAWVGAVTAGDALHGPDGRVYEITAVTAAGSLTITPAYLGSTASGQVYAIQPTRAWTKPLLDTVAAWLAGQQGYVDGPLAGRFGDGTALLPGLAFVGDVDTGLARLAANVLGLIAGGAERARVTAAGMQVTGLLTGTAVQSSPTDTTAGRLLTAGAFGWGATAAVVSGLDIDGIVVTGNYSVTSGVISGSPNFWAPAATSGSSLLHIGYDANSAAQILIHRNSGRAALRTRSVGAWGPWREIYHQASILGTVSQASGVPTGALIERGSNANGEYARWADGTQMCWGAVTSTQTQDVATGALYRTAGVSWTYPAAFSAAPAVLPGAAADTNAWVTFDAPTATAVFMRRVGTQSGATNVVHRACAIGRWY